MAFPTKTLIVPDSCPASVEEPIVRGTRWASMRGDGISIETVTGRDAMSEFAGLPFLVYGEREAWWPPDVQNEIDLLSGRAAIAAHLDMMPFMARRGGKLAARVTAAVNFRYNSHWNERLGQLIHFEA